MMLHLLDKLFLEGSGAPAELKKARCLSVIEWLKQDKRVLGVLLGGSLSYKANVPGSDVDLFCLVENVNGFEVELQKRLIALPDTEVVVYQGSFPWTGKLYTVYYKSDIDLSIDICLIARLDAETFFWEPEGYILYDTHGIIGKCRSAQTSSLGYTRQPFLKNNPFSLAVVTLKKISKNLSRGHLWNALEQLSVLRRYIMQIIRLDLIKNNNFLGRVDRDIEDVIPVELNRRLSATTAGYNVADIAQKTILLVEMIESLIGQLKAGKEAGYHDWVLRQLQYEKNKLSEKYI